MKKIIILILFLIVTLTNVFYLQAGDDYKKYNFVQYSNYYSKSDSVIKTYNDFKAATSQSVKCTLNLENNPTCEDIDETRSGFIIINFRAGKNHYKLGNKFDVTNSFNSNLSVKVNVMDDNGFVTNLLNKKLTVLGNATEVRPEHSYKIELSDMSTIGATDFKKLEFELYACDSLFSGNLVNKSSELTFEAFYVLDRKYKAEDNSSSDPLVYVQFDLNPSTLHKKYQFTDSDPNNQFRTVQLEWHTTCTDYGFEKYNLQLLKLENTLGEYNEFITEVDWDNALNIEVGDYKKYIDLYITQGTGYYTWRVRPIGTWYEGGVSNSKNWGEWNSESMEQGLSFDISSTNSNYFYFYYQQADTNINWIHARFFNESDKGKTKFFDEITYSDELLGKRQYQKRINSEDDVVISEFIADYSGEIVVSSLPAPVSSETGWESDYDTVINMQPDFGVDLKYKKEALKTGVNRFNVVDFDVSNIVTSNSSVYESSEITDGLIYDYYDDSGIPGVPKSQGYPYSRTIYYNDGTGRLREQRFPGEVSHTTPVSTERYGRVKTFYSNVSEDELIPIFGKETPATNKMFKIITIDQNGVYHITYKEFNGNTIATAIKYDQYKGNNNLEPIRSNPTNEHYLGEQGYQKRNVLSKIEEEEKGKTKFDDESSFLIDDPGNSFMTYGIELKPFTVDGNCISSSGGLILGNTSLEIPIDFHLSVVNKGAFHADPVVFDYSTTTKTLGTITPATLPLSYTLPGTEESDYRFRRSIQFDRDYIFNFIENYKEDIISHFHNENSGYKREIENLTEIINGNVDYDIESFRDSLTSTWGWFPPDPNAETDLERNYYKKPVIETCGLNILAYLPKDPCKAEPACGTDPDYEALLFDLMEGKVVKIVDQITYDGNGYVLDQVGTIKSFGRNIDEYLFREGQNMFDGLDFYFDSANVQTNNGVINQMIENMLAETYESSYLTDSGFVDMDSVIWREEDICDCWNMTINNFENLGIKNLEIADGEFALYFDKKFSIIDEFLDCTGTIFEGYSNTRFNDTTNLRIGHIEKDTLTDDNLVPPFGEGYIENAYKYLPHDFLIPILQEYTHNYSVENPNKIDYRNSPVEQFFDVNEITSGPSSGHFEFSLKSTYPYLPRHYIYRDWDNQLDYSYNTQTKDVPLSPNNFIPFTNDNGKQIKDDICNGTYSISLQRIYNYNIGKYNPPYCSDASDKSAEEVQKEKQKKFNNDREEQNKNTDLDDITDKNDPFSNIQDGLEFDSWEDALLFYVDQCQESCSDTERKFEARIRHALRNHAQNYITDDATRWISDFGEFDIVTVGGEKKLREY
ncbi:MAG: hypothetical protein R2863_12115, partial [Candidatus Kapaibacterium sp.]